MDIRIAKRRKKSSNPKPPAYSTSGGPKLRSIRYSSYSKTSNHKKEKDVCWFGRLAMLYLASLDKPRGFWPVCSFPPRDSAAESVVSLIALPAPLVVSWTVLPKPLTSKLRIAQGSVPFFYIEEVIDATLESNNNSPVPAAVLVRPPTNIRHTISEPWAIYVGPIGAERSRGQATTHQRHQAYLLLHPQYSRQYLWLLQEDLC